MDDEKPVTFIGTTNSNDSTEMVHEFERPGTITGALVGTEVGQEYALQLYASLIRSGSQTNLWHSLDQAFLAGNGRDYDVNLRFEFEKGDKLRLRAVNENAAGHEYHHAVVVRVDYETGFADRIASALGRIL